MTTTTIKTFTLLLLYPTLTSSADAYYARLSRLDEAPVGVLDTPYYGEMWFEILSSGVSIQTAHNTVWDDGCDTVMLGKCVVLENSLTGDMYYPVRQNLSGVSRVYYPGIGDTIPKESVMGPDFNTTSQKGNLDDGLYRVSVIYNTPGLKKISGWLIPQAAQPNWLTSVENASAPVNVTAPSLDVEVESYVDTIPGRPSDAMHPNRISFSLKNLDFKNETVFLKSADIASSLIAMQSVLGTSLTAEGTVFLSSADAQKLRGTTMYAEDGSGRKLAEVQIDTFKGETFELKAVLQGQQISSDIKNTFDTVGELTVYVEVTYTNTLFMKYDLTGLSPSGTDIFDMRVGLPFVDSDDTIANFSMGYVFEKNADPTIIPPAPMAYPASILSAMRSGAMFASLRSSTGTEMYRGQLQPFLRSKNYAQVAEMYNPNPDSYLPYQYPVPGLARVRSYSSPWGAVEAFASSQFSNGSLPASPTAFHRLIGFWLGDGPISLGGFGSWSNLGGITRFSLMERESEMRVRISHSSEPDFVVDGPLEDYSTNYYQAVMRTDEHTGHAVFNLQPGYNITWNLTHSVQGLDGEASCNRTYSCLVMIRNETIVANMLRGRHAGPADVAAMSGVVFEDDLEPGVTLKGLQDSIRKGLVSLALLTKKYPDAPYGELSATMVATTPHKAFDSFNSEQYVRLGLDMHGFQLTYDAAFTAPPCGSCVSPIRLQGTSTYDLPARSLPGTVVGATPSDIPFQTARDLFQASVTATVMAGTPVDVFPTGSRAWAFTFTVADTPVTAVVDQKTFTMNYTTPTPVYIRGPRNTGVLCDDVCVVAVTPRDLAELRAGWWVAYITEGVDEVPIMTNEPVDIFSGLLFTQDGDFTQAEMEISVHPSSGAMESTLIVPSNIECVPMPCIVTAGRLGNFTAQSSIYDLPGTSYDITWDRYLASIPLLKAAVPSILMLMFRTQGVEASLTGNRVAVMGKINRKTGSGDMAFDCVGGSMQGFQTIPPVKDTPFEARITKLTVKNLQMEASVYNQVPQIDGIFIGIGGVGDNGFTVHDINVSPNAVIGADLLRALVSGYGYAVVIPFHHNNQGETRCQLYLKDTPAQELYVDQLAATPDAGTQPPYAIDDMGALSKPKILPLLTLYQSGLVYYRVVHAMGPALQGALELNAPSGATLRSLTNINGVQIPLSRLNTTWGSVFYALPWERVALRKGVIAFNMTTNNRKGGEVVGNVMSSSEGVVFKTVWGHGAVLTVGSWQMMRVTYTVRGKMLVPTVDVDAATTVISLQCPAGTFITGVDPVEVTESMLRCLRGGLGRVEVTNTSSSTVAGTGIVTPTDTLITSGDGYLNSAYLNLGTGSSGTARYQLHYASGLLLSTQMRFTPLSSQESQCNMPCGVTSVGCVTLHSPDTTPCAPLLDFGLMTTPSSGYITTTLSGSTDPNLMYKALMLLTDTTTARVTSRGNTNGEMETGLYATPLAGIGFDNDTSKGEVIVFKAQVDGEVGDLMYNRVTRKLATSTLCVPKCGYSWVPSTNSSSTTVLQGWVTVGEAVPEYVVSGMLSSSLYVNKGDPAKGWGRVWQHQPAEMFVTECSSAFLPVPAQFAARCFATFEYHPSSNHLLYSVATTSFTDCADSCVVLRYRDGTLISVLSPTLSPSGQYQGFIPASITLVDRLKAGEVVLDLSNQARGAVVYPPNNVQASSFRAHLSNLQVSSKASSTEAGTGYATLTIEDEVKLTTKLWHNTVNGQCPTILKTGCLQLRMGTYGYAGGMAGVLTTESVVSPMTVSSVVLSGPHLRALRNGWTYLTINTNRFPDGSVRGQVQGNLPSVTAGFDEGIFDTTPSPLVMQGHVRVDYIGGLMAKVQVIHNESLTNTVKEMAWTGTRKPVVITDEVSWIPIQVSDVVKMWLDGSKITGNMTVAGEKVELSPVVPCRGACDTFTTNMSLYNTAPPVNERCGGDLEAKCMTREYCTFRDASCEGVTGSSPMSYRSDTKALSWDMTHYYRAEDVSSPNCMAASIPGCAVIQLGSPGTTQPLTADTLQWVPTPGYMLMSMIATTLLPPVVGGALLPSAVELWALQRGALHVSIVGSASVKSVMRGGILPTGLNFTGMMSSGNLTGEFIPGTGDLQGVGVLKYKLQHANAPDKCTNTPGCLYITMKGKIAAVLDYGRSEDDGVLTGEVQLTAPLLFMFATQTSNMPSQAAVVLTDELGRVIEEAKLIPDDPMRLPQPPFDVTSPPPPTPTLTLVESDSSSDSILSQWWFWLIIGLVLFLLIMLVAYLRYKKDKKKEATNKEFPMKEKTEAMLHEEPPLDMGRMEPAPPAPLQRSVDVDIQNVDNAIDQGFTTTDKYVPSNLDSYAVPHSAVPHSVVPLRPVNNLPQLPASLPQVPSSSPNHREYTPSFQPQQTLEFGDTSPMGQAPLPEPVSPWRPVSPFYTSQNEVAFLRSELEKREAQFSLRRSEHDQLDNELHDLRTELDVRDARLHSRRDENAHLQSLLDTARQGYDVSKLL